jgi:signal transduction histidine kinase
LGELVEEVCDSFAAMAAEKALELVSAAGSEVTMFSDRRRVKQVLVNLVSNAVKFTENGSVKIKAGQVGDGMVEIQVVDTGIGISREDVARLFVPFQQVDRSLVKSHEGSGLGLYLSGRIAEMLHGKITVSSSPGRGSEFTFRLPARHGEEPGHEKGAHNRR